MKGGQSGKPKADEPMRGVRSLPVEFVSISIHREIVADPSTSGFPLSALRFSL
jgi:hypothetical protein